MPKAQPYQNQPGLTILCARSPRRHWTLPKPPPTVDAQTVAALDTVYQAAVKANDVAIMDRILADDFVLVTDRGASLTKADLIKEAREKRTIYEHQEEEEGTQKVRIWRDTAVVTALLRIKGTRDQNPFDYKVWSVRLMFGRLLVGVTYLGKSFETGRKIVSISMTGQRHESQIHSPCARIRTGMR